MFWLGLAVGGIVGFMVAVLGIAAARADEMSNDWMLKVKDNEIQRLREMINQLQRKEYNNDVDKDKQDSEH